MRLATSGVDFGSSAGTDRYTPRIDQGERIFRFWFNAGPVTDRLKAIDREAMVKNEKPFALSFYPSGSGQKPKGGPTLSDSVVQLTALKRAENGNDLIVRLFNPTNRIRSTTLSMPFISMRKKVKLGSYEIKTLRIKPSKRSVIEVNLLE